MISIDFSDFSWFLLISLRFEISFAIAVKSKPIRKLFSNIFVFRVSKNELETIFEEVVESKKDYIYDIAKIVFSTPHQYLFINTDSQRLFKGFDEIIIND